MSVISGAHSDPITYPGIPKLYWAQLTLTRDTNHPPMMSKHGSVANSKHVTLTVPHKLEIIWGF